MKKHLLIALIALGLGLGLTLMVSTPSMAVHKGSGDLTCGSCHTMHSSQGGTNASSMGGATGSFILLRNPNVSNRSQIHNLCLQCHAQGGSQADVPQNAGNAATTPPKVFLTSLGWTQGSDFSTIGAGGDFKSVGTYNGSTFTETDGANALGKGHSLGISNPTPPGNSASNTPIGLVLTAFSCTSCHDPHGTSTTTTTINKYRNLKAGSSMSDNAAQKPITNMAALGDIASSYVGGVTAPINNLQGLNCASGQTCVWPVYRSTGTQNAYKVSSTAPTSVGGNIVPTDGSSVLMSAFCAQCHGAWHEGYQSTNKTGNDWARHPVDNRLEDDSGTSGAGVDIVDFTWYSTTSGNADAAKLPAANNDATVAYYATSGADKVFCLSCHFAHGSPYYDILRWEYTSAVEQGSQLGNGVLGTKGCQQCHNR